MQSLEKGPDVARTMGILDRISKASTKLRKQLPANDLRIDMEEAQAEAFTQWVLWIRAYLADLLLEASEPNAKLSVAQEYGWSLARIEGQIQALQAIKAAILSADAGN